jgi:hypothetical protein
MVAAPTASVSLPSNSSLTAAAAPAFSTSTESTLVITPSVCVTPETTKVPFFYAVP